MRRQAVDDMVADVDDFIRVKVCAGPGMELEHDCVEHCEAGDIGVFCVDVYG